jgi:hypothetical protein
MKKSLSDNITLLNEDAKKIQNVGFSILFSINRNRFFSYLKNYIAFYNEFRNSVLDIHPNLNNENLPELQYKSYSLSIRYQLLLTITFPLTFVVFLHHWKYLKKIKVDLSQGLIAINTVVKKATSKNTNMTPPKAKRK